MRIKRLTVLFLLALLLAGCKELYHPIDSPKAVTTTGVKPSTWDTPTVIGNIDDLDDREKILNFDTAPGDELHPEQIPSDCTGPSDLPRTQFIKSKGLVIMDTTLQQLIVSGDAGLEEPIYSVQAKSPDSILAEWDVSPDGEWLSYLDFTNVSLFDAWIENIKTGEKIKKHFAGSTISWSGIYWADDHQIVIPLRNEGDLFQWIVWDPFTQSEERVSASLAGIGQAVEGFDIFPVYDPDTRTILNVCDQCGENDFQIYSLDSGEIIESIDFGNGTFTDPEWAPYHSPGMQYTAFHFGGNKLWIFDQNGDSKLKVILPFAEYSSWTGRTYRWSNDGKYLAMFRENPGTPQYFLSILDLESKTIKNLCAKIAPGTIRWSPDNRFLVSMSYRSADDEEGTLSIVEVKTGKGETMVTTRGGYLVGWLIP